MTRALVRMPRALSIALVYVTARAVTALMLVAAASASTAGSRFGAAATVGDLSLGWDAQWYWYIAVNGYPSTLPTTAQGVGENAWAFMPLYAWASNAVGSLFGSWGVGAVIVSLLCGYLACLVLFRLLAPRTGRIAAFWAVVFFAAGPLGALFQVGYAESAFLLLLFLGLDALVRRRYGLLYAIIPVMGFVRPGVLAFALMLGLVLALRWWRRRTDPLSSREIVHFFALGALAVAVGFAWQVIAGIVTGDPGAYLETELAWRRNWSTGETTGFLPFEGWVSAAQFWFAFWGLPPWLGVVVLVLLVAGFGGVLLRGPGVRRLGPELRLWSASYALYLLAVFFPQSSTLRLLVPLSPLWGAVAAPRGSARATRMLRVGVLALGLALQWLWIWNVYAMGDTFWRVP
ncbi:hypothetical protein GCM10025768_16280 [Microbacterium pseudoresistens]|uniref:Integral membrane protein n=1 Tax=Microbacterium pseudoresistens TaxID=640634 RepID=A0A7Y9JL50_9MICO|nr:hypothetical protein [Microbacterium pseudoresistens]NYD53020.1 hypothetical protein [Microbacterium pseudoresistens]